MKQTEQIGDRPELRHKPAPLTCSATATVRQAVAAMNAQNFGCVVVVDDAQRVEGILSERDVMRRVVHTGLDPETTRVADVMTSNPRCARNSDLVLDWLRVMSNERFRRVPVVDDDGRLMAIFTMGDFVAYTWPDLIYDRPAKAAGATLDLRLVAMIGGGVLLYSLIIAAIFALG
ncbi:CBS domain-containing protein [Pontivivens insulae]|uniref:Arabinose 5-phosphate isomerase KdsD n=1 Tax=Pontivivens insulae TaxID=1639689 RepID=A0A2R8A9N9_9RHOB|nr:CBS domain-containing protein [Pontivivens insulae]RED12841.1 CBS domain protein [Pontivivens insulae]SPF28932.1 Arabinose 5-phosphate isomerase KdsD [Pontivivens insulae]